MWQTIFWLSLTGALGCLARYGLGGLIQKYSAGFPYGTLAINTLACFLFGLVWTLASERLIISGHVRLIILTGFIGTFSTFSTFVFETGQMLRDTELLLAAVNVALELGAGLVFFFLGIMLGKQF
jgi:CrcB protein